MFCCQDWSGVNINLKLLGLEGGVTINASQKCEETSIMTGYSLSFLWEGVHLKKKQKHLNFNYHTMKFYNCDHTHNGGLMQKKKEKGIKLSR